MTNINKISLRKSEFVEQLTTLLNTSFENFPSKFEVEEWEAENMGEKGLYFSVSTKITGCIYENFFNVKSNELIFEVEEEFINVIINDLIIAGISRFIQIKDVSNQGKPKKMMEISAYLN